MKQTAVEWLVEDLGVYLPISITSVQLSINQAKEMEKEQIIDFGNDLLAQNDQNYIAVPDLAKQYYNETFKNK